MLGWAWGRGREPGEGLFTETRAGAPLLCPCGNSHQALNQRGLRSRWGLRAGGGAALTTRLSPPHGRWTRVEDKARMQAQL